MKIITDEINIKTSKDLEIVDISSKISEIVKSSKIKHGLINIFTRHSTSAIVINENEPRLIKDFENLLMKIVPENETYGHNIIDNNAAAHLRSFLLGGSQSIPIQNGYLDLGTWQSIFFVELDGPRNRKVKITILGQ
ncbi:MAG: secondary thiamine-phosphate synthase enzyme YjbQ [Methanobacteriaceae archaeon]|nr:secondary thiamine-phosphate synthase enzyme YjbQ [Methanobacteriaceae archaeon]